MNPDLTFWDHVSLGLALLFVFVFIVIRIKQALVPSSSGCGGCSSGGACGGQPVKQCKENEQKIQVTAIEKKMKTDTVK